MESRQLIVTVTVSVEPAVLTLQENLLTADFLCTIKKKKYRLYNIELLFFQKVATSPISNFIICRSVYFTYFLCKQGFSIPIKD